MMPDKLKALIESRPEMQFLNTVRKAQSLFGNQVSFNMGKGMGNKLGGRPSFMNCKSRFGYSNFMRARGGG